MTTETSSTILEVTSEYPFATSDPLAVQLQQQVDCRLNELRALASEDQVAWSNVSESALRAFLSTCTQATRPMITHLDNGNLRAVWTGQQDDQAALQFLDADNLQLVAFTRRPGASSLTQLTARGSRADIIAQLRAFGLLPLLVA